MSKYATLTSIAESPVTPGVLVVGTDDGSVQVSSNAGGSWSRAAPLPGLPPQSFINDVEASLHDGRTIYAVADAHKTGDFTPYVFESSDLGRTWRSIVGDLPKGTIAWAIQQDHVQPNLLFLGTEFGLYFSPNRGVNWFKLSGGVPTISFRDVKLHRRDNDLVGATFGRGVYVLDDYTPLRAIAAGALAAEGALLPVRDAWWYVPSQPSQAPGRPEAGSDDFTTDNPPFGALITYYLRDIPTTAREAREAREKTQREQNASTPFPGFDQLRAEALESGPKVLLLVSDANGRRVSTLEGPAKAGLHRVSWNLRGPNPNPIDLSPPGFRSPWDDPPRGPLMAPGRYSVELMVVSASGVRRLGTAQSFEVKPVPNAPAGTDFIAVAAFQQQAAELQRRIGGAGAALGRVGEQLRHMRAALVQTPRADPALYARIDSVGRSLAAFELLLSGHPARQRLSESEAPSIRERVGQVIGGHWETRQMPTATMRRDIGIATASFEALMRDLTTLLDGDLARLEADLEAAGAPWTPRRRPR
jgi:hypothetical protein